MKAVAAVMTTAATIITTTIMTHADAAMTIATTATAATIIATTMISTIFTQGGKRYIS